MLKKDISVVKYALQDGMSTKAVWDAFDRIKKLIEEAQNTSTNSASVEIFCDDICEYCQNNQLGSDACVECQCSDSETEEYIHFVGRKLHT